MLTVHQRHRQTDRQTDGRKIYDSNTALAIRASRSKNPLKMQDNKTSSLCALNTALLKDEFGSRCRSANIFVSSIPTLIFHKRLGCSRTLLLLFLQIYGWVYQWKNWENRSTFDEVMTKKLVVGLIFGPPCICKNIDSLIRDSWLAARFYQIANKHIDTAIRYDTPRHNATLSNWRTAGIDYRT